MGSGNSHLYSGTYGSKQRTSNSGTKSYSQGNDSAMPYRNNAFTDSKKFTDYSLNPNHPTGKDKAKVYKSALGYDKSNYSSLVNQIDKSVKSGKLDPISSEKSSYGVKYKYEIPVKGPNGKTEKVTAVYMLSKGSHRPRLITNYIDK